MSIIADALYEDLRLTEAELEESFKVFTEEKAKEDKPEKKVRKKSVKKEEELQEEMYVDIPVEPDMILESKQKKEPLKESAIRKPGTAEYDSNEGRIKRVNHFRKVTNMSEGEELTEAFIDENDWAVKQTSCYFNRPSARIRAELLNQKYTGLEQYEN